MSDSQPRADIVVVGAGIVGLATAMKLQERFPDRSLLVAEAEGRVGAHQSGHNSGVIHSGIYYKPGSVKAICCRRGKQAMEAFCQEHQIAWDRCGKVVVATNAEELPRLDRIAERAKENGVGFERIDTDQLRELEPAAAGIAGLHVPETGIVNFRDVCDSMARIIRSRGGRIELGFQVQGIDMNSSTMQLDGGRGQAIECAQLVNCAGIQSDRVCRLAGGNPASRNVPFRGEYYELEPHRESLCRNLIYPVPDPSFPFLGVHFTRMVGGGVECGPNAVLALSRHGYRWRDINFADMASTFGFGGFRKLAIKHWRMGVGEVHRSLSKAAFVSALQKLIPSIRASDLKPGRAGVRAQAVTAAGDLVDDFLIERTGPAVHVLNAPSPGATASLAIAEKIIENID